MNAICSICTISVSDEVYATFCGHLYHRACIVSWLDKEHSCPDCRTTCSQSQIFRIFTNSSVNDSDSIICDTLLNKIDHLNYIVTEKDVELLEKSISIEQLNETIISVNQINDNKDQEIEKLKTENENIDKKLKLCEVENDRMKFQLSDYSRKVNFLERKIQNSGQNKSDILLFGPSQILNFGPKKQMRRSQRLSKKRPYITKSIV